MVIPEVIAREIKVALSFYPELNTTKVYFVLKKKIKKSTMQARPTFSSFFKHRKNRSYIILIKEKIKISDKEFFIQNIPSNVLIGWLGHELGHVMDYRNRSHFNLIMFGFKYLFSFKFIKEAEKAADSYAITHGMEKYILETKDFILNKSNISDRYRRRIIKYYLSPEEIMKLVEERDKK